MRSHLLEDCCAGFSIHIQHIQSTYPYLIITINESDKKDVWQDTVHRMK
jgi:hypothetical protein